MQYIYIDNFRGFKDTLIPIKDVNFLVGENSTGKTSILYLIHSFSSLQFWVKQQFMIDEYSFLNFKDIISISSENQKNFKTGFIEIDEKKTDNIYAVLIEFTEEDGLPVISRYHFINGRKAGIFIIEKGCFKYNITSLNYKKNIHDEVIATYKKWTKKRYSEDNLKKVEYKKLRPILEIYHLIEDNLIEDTLEKKNIKQNSRKQIYNITTPDFTNNLTWIAPIRSKPKKVYDQIGYNFTPEGDHIPYIIQKFIKHNGNTKKFTKIIEDFGKNSGLFKTVTTNKFSDSSDSPFELNITLDDKPINITNVGYGVSQCLPVIVELILRPTNTWYAIQQPEVHLHPKAQASFGDLIYNLAVEEKKRFFIETHSDYTIDRFRLNYRNKTNKINSQILFFERDKGFNKVSSIEIDNNGHYSEEQPDSFREFFLNEEMNILGLK